MQTRWYRTHILLKAAQRRRLTQIARQEGRSVSEVTRALLDLGLQAREQAASDVLGQRAHAFKQAQKLREKIQRRRGEEYLKLDLTTTLYAVRETRLTEMSS